MSDDSKKAQKSLVHFRRQELAMRSNDLVKRGLAQLRRRKCYVRNLPSRFCIGTLYTVDSSDSSFWWDQEWEEFGGVTGKVFAPSNKKLILKICEREEAQEIWVSILSDHEGQTANYLLPLSELDSNDLQGLDLSRASISYLEEAGWENIEYLYDLKGMEWLSLRENKIIDEQLGFLSEMTSLQYLDLSDTEVCGSALYGLKDSKLRELSLNTTNVGEVNGLGFLHYLPYLEKLDLGGNNEVTINCLYDLSTLTNLKELVIDFVYWDNFEIKELDDALPPDCEIIQR